MEVSQLTETLENEHSWIAVLAGTPVDSQMGVSVLAQHGYEGRAFPLAEDPWKQTAFQLAPSDEKQRVVRQVLEMVQHQGCKKAFVYCNSLSAAVNFTVLSNALDMTIVTPLLVYQDLACQYQHLGVIAANAQGLAGIERTLYAANPSLDLLGSCALGVVQAIEAHTSAADIVTLYHLEQLTKWFEQCGMEALLLGCTHFPYIKNVLSQCTSLPLIDPAEAMVQKLFREE